MPCTHRSSFPTLSPPGACAITSSFLLCASHSFPSSLAAPLRLRNGFTSTFLFFFALLGDSVLNHHCNLLHLSLLLVFFFSFPPPSTADPFDSADVAGSASDARRRYQNTKKKPVMCMSHVAAAFSIPRFSAWCILRARLCVECMRKKEKYKT